MTSADLIANSSVSFSGKSEAWSSNFIAVCVTYCSLGYSVGTVVFVSCGSGSQQGGRFNNVLWDEKWMLECIMD